MGFPRETWESNGFVCLAISIEACAMIPRHAKGKSRALISQEITTFFLHTKRKHKANGQVIWCKSCICIYLSLYREIWWWEDCSHPWGWGCINSRCQGWTWWAWWVACLWHLYWRVGLHSAWWPKGPNLGDPIFNLTICREQLLKMSNHGEPIFDPTISREQLLMSPIKALYGIWH